MEKVALYLLLTILLLTGVLLISFLISSFFENEKKAIKRSFVILSIWCVVFIVLFFIPNSFYLWLLIVSMAVFVLVMVKFGNQEINFKVPDQKFDERDVIFSRNALQKGTQNYHSYYDKNPDKKLLDDKFRKEPGLLSKGSYFYNELMFSAADATFQTVNLLQPLVDNNPSKLKSELPDSEIAEFITNWAKKLGACDVGFTTIKPHHLYSHIGRGEDYGKKVELDHEFAIVFTVEMNHNSMQYNPQGPVIMESAQQYLNAGQIAVQIASFLCNLGYDARAHIDANYRLICPTVAMDAGLGVIGRMGLLITPKYGPRVRIGVVSTNLNLQEMKKVPDYSVIHFCNICKKCAENCPSKSISYSSQKASAINDRWNIKHEKCYTYWCKAGTDCGRCMAVCPYSHPNNFPHNLIRWMLKRNPVNRLIALKLDNFFYGRKPKSYPLKNLMNSN